MSTSVTFNGTTYSIPSSGETGWASLSSFLIDVANNAQTLAAQRGAIRVATSSPVTVSSTDYTVLSNLAVAGAVAVTLPAGVNKTIYIIGDTKGDAQTNNITITPNSGNINGAATYVIKNNYGAVMLQYSTSAGEWKVISRYFTKIDAANEVYGILSAANGGTGIANNAASTLSISGNFATTLTVSGVTALTLPTTGTVAVTQNKLSVFAATTSAELAGVISDETGSGKLTFATGPQFTTNADLLAGGEHRYYNAGNTFYTGFKGGNAAANKIWTLPLVDGTNGMALKTDGSGTLAFASVSGSGSINYITESDFEDNAVTGWATYADAAATTPVDGTGGSPNSTFAATASSPLRGLYSGLFTKGAANRQGEGFSYAFTIATADKSRPLVVSWEGSASANYTGSSGTEYLAMYIYDVTNATLITPASTTVGSGVSKGSAFFVATTSTSYRLIFHVAGTGTSAWTYTIDTVSVGPQSMALGFAGTDWQTFTPTGSWTTNTTYTGRWRRVGDTMEMMVGITLAGAPNAATQLALDMPTGYALDTTKLAITSRAMNLGEITTYRGAYTAPGWAEYDSTVSNGTLKARFFAMDSTGTTNTEAAITTTVPGTWANGDYIELNLKLPISTWTSSVTTADRAVEEYAYNSSTSTSANDTTSFAYGPAGAQIQNITAALARRVRFNTPIQPTDSIILEMSTDRIKWFSLSQSAFVNAQLVIPFITENSTSYGAGALNQVTSSSTDVDVNFGTYAGQFSKSTVGGAGQAWSTAAGSGYWRVKKVSSGATVGFPIAPGNITLINTTDNYAGNTKLGLMTYAHGTSYNGSIAPTITLSAGGGTLSSVDYSAFVPYQVSDGTWRCKFNIAVTLSSTSRTAVRLAINGWAASATAAQAIQGFSGSTGSAFYNALSETSGTILSQHAALTATAYYFSGDIALASKPTWAY